ncbi:phosphotransferase [Mycolicibacterium mucogenicum]|uniref:Phosphotransferase n=1 Tax=Mycolicibacterium mucogenicum DSM 44124 TaxID=1226753 RepID=A0A8H2JCN0_MYCMU|nr:phosphotransferase [Mycolicibacterium mucogenicum]KAB7751135.1 TfxG immunity protein against TfxA peptides [Mycolicibacterium mucogenicum DSM 44124]QPG66919.1 phosphotransferase [Mycolicibacterium mucogenicum DSM 44124]
MVAVNDTAERLAGGWGGTVLRTGGTVRRSTGHWTPAVHELLKHLESVGFAGAPRVFGVDSEGHEVLTFIDGQTAASAEGWPVWLRFEANLVRVARLLRQFHDAVESFRPGPELHWRDGSRGLKDGEIIGHNDVSLANLVADSTGRIHSLIDWDHAGPTTRRRELAYAAWHVVGLHARDHARARGWSKAPDVARRLRMFLDAYGLDDREGFVDDIIGRIGEAVRSCRAAVDAGDHGARPFVALLERDLEFVRRHRCALEQTVPA